MIDIVSELRALHTFNQDNYVGHLSLRSADEIDRLRNEIERLLSDRAYVIGWNDGFEHGRGQ